MSLTNALSNAMSGLAYASRGTEVVAANIANAQTPGYARREIQLSPRPHVANGGGVQIDSVARVVQQSVLAQHRISAAGASGAATLTSFARHIEQAIGTPGEPGSLTTTLADFEAALLAAAARPENEAKLAGVLSTAGALMSKINQLGNSLQDSRMAADRAISQDVTTLSSGLEQVADLNRRIAVHVAQGDDATTLMDRRQALISELSEIVPLQELPRENGRVALVTKGGALLLDGTKPLPIDFQSSPHIVAGMSAGNPLSRLIVNGAELSAGQMTMFAGGRLAANFTIRDQSAPDLQAGLDGFALDLVQRAADPAVDPSLAAGQRGLFADLGGLPDAADLPGLASRIQLNPVADPAAGGTLWRLRDGMEAPAPGPAGDAGLLGRLSEALTQPRLPSGDVSAGAPQSAQSFAADISSRTARQRLGAEADQSRATAEHDALSDLLGRDGVDTDRELENLLNLERAYAANAKVLKAVDDMLLNILGLT